MQARSELNQVIEFIYIYSDFFNAQFDSLHKYKTWAIQKNQVKRIKPLLKDLVDAIKQGKNDLDAKEEIRRYQAALQALRQSNRKLINQLIQQNPSLITALKKYLQNPIVHTWYQKQATRNQNTDRLKRQTEVQIARYKSVSAKYRKHLGEEIKKEVNAISNVDSLKALHENLFNTPPEKDQKISFTKVKIVDGLLDQQKEFSPTMNTQLENEPKLMDALKKNAIISKAETILNNANGNLDHDFQTIHNFRTYLENNKNTLTKSRNSAFENFIKGLGVFAAGIFGFGVGSVMAYQYFFSPRRTTGHQVFEEIIRINRNVMGRKIS